MLCEACLWLRTKVLLNFTWDDVQQNLEACESLWSEFPWELQARLCVTKVTFTLRDGIARLEPDGSCLGLFMALPEYFYLSSAMNQEAETFQGTSPSFVGLLARLMEQAEKLENGPAEDVTLDLEEALKNVQEDASGEACGKEALELRRAFEETWVPRLSVFSFRVTGKPYLIPGNL